jgi:glycosyltransferase involved in cell wall biosynthesis
VAKRRRIHLSGVVVAQDNEQTIGTVLDNLVPHCDEVVVVDGGSHDRTPEIAASKPEVRLHRRPFDGNISTQKNFALDQCQGEWVLILDTDELLGGRRVGWLRGLTRVPGIRWYSLPRFWLVEQDGVVHYLAGKPYYRDRQLRLFRNDPGFRYDTSRSPIHHQFLNKRGPGKPLRHPHIFHYTFLLQDRTEREAKVAKYLGTEPGTAHLHSMYLWEEAGVPTRPVPHGLPGVLRSAAAIENQT